MPVGESRSGCDWPREKGDVKLCLDDARGWCVFVLELRLLLLEKFGLGDIRPSGNVVDVGDQADDPVGVGDLKTRLDTETAEAGGPRSAIDIADGDRL